MTRLLLILFAVLALEGAGCISSNEAGFVVNGSSTIIPGQIQGGEIRAGTFSEIPSVSVDDLGL